MIGNFGGSPGGPANTVLYKGHSPVNLHYRPLQPSDYDALKVIHRELFPIDYEEVFFTKAVAGEDRVFSWAALHSEHGRDHLVGFITARMVYLYECDPMDRQVMGLNSKCLDGECAVYVLTLGVVRACRQCGIARSLLCLVQQHAARLRCRAIFLHVISYNEAAMRLYGTSGYQPMARLPNFYHLVTGRQPNPDKSWYDAFLYALFIPSSGPQPSPTMQWAGGMLGAAVAPLRSMMGTFNGCIPAWFCRQTCSTFLPFATTATTNGAGVSQRSSSKSSLTDTATSVLQQQLQPQQLQQQQQRPPSPASTTSSHSRKQHQQHKQHQHQPLPTSTIAGVVCAGVTAEQFLKRGHQQQQSQQHPFPQQEQQQRCMEPERCQKDWGTSRQTAAGSSSSSSPVWPGSQGQQQYSAGASSLYGLDAGGRGSSATSSWPMSSDQQQHQLLLLMCGLPLQQPTVQSQSRQYNQHHNHNPNQQPQLYATPMLRPPSPPIPPSLSQSMMSLQQRLPHSTGSGSSVSASIPTYASASGQGLSGPNHHCSSHHMLHQHQAGHGSQYGAGNGNGAHGRTGEHSRGGIPRGGPQGMPGGGLHSQQQSGSVLAALFRPPTAQSHPHSR